MSRFRSAQSRCGDPEGGLSAWLGPPGRAHALFVAQIMLSRLLNSSKQTRPMPICSLRPPLCSNKQLADRTITTSARSDVHLSPRLPMIWARSESKSTRRDRRRGRPLRHCRIALTCGAIVLERLLSACGVSLLASFIPTRRFAACVFLPRVCFGLSFDRASQPIRPRLRSRRPCDRDESDPRGNLPPGNLRRSRIIQPVRPP